MCQRICCAELADVPSLRSRTFKQKVKMVARVECELRTSCEPSGRRLRSVADVRKLYGESSPRPPVDIVSMAAIRIHTRSRWRGGGGCTGQIVEIIHCCSGFVCFFRRRTHYGKLQRPNNVFWRGVSTGATDGNTGRVPPPKNAEKPSPHLSREVWGQTWSGLSRA